jgi:transcriptional regulator with XRE-family HTH domain
MIFAHMDYAIKSPSELQRELGETIRALRIGRGLTQAEVAAKAGVALRSLAALERLGKSSLETFVRALNALQASDLIGKMAPQSQVSPLAILHNKGKARRRVRHRT